MWEGRELFHEAAGTVPVALGHQEHHLVPPLAAVSLACVYRELRDAALQRCLDALGIRSIVVEGASIARLFRSVLQERLPAITYLGGGRRVVVSTLQFPHALWRQSELDWAQTLSAQPPSDNSTIRFWLGAGFYSSQRLDHITLDRAMLFESIAESILPAKGWLKLELHTVTAAFTFDTAGQGDGMHIGGPPMKVVLDKMVHYLCEGHRKVGKPWTATGHTGMAGQRTSATSRAL